MNLGHDLNSRGAVKALVTSFEKGTASGMCRNRLRLTGGTGGRVSGSGKVVDGDVFRHSRELPYCDSEGGMTTKIPLLRRLDRYHETANRIQ